MLTKYLLHTPQPLLIINTRGTKYTEDAAVGQNSTAFQDVVEAGFKPWRSGSGTLPLAMTLNPSVPAPIFLTPLTSATTLDKGR